MESFAILIDGGFARRKLSEKLGSGQSLTSLDFSKLIDNIQNHHVFKDKRLYRVFYYDAFPSDERLTNPIDSSVFDLSATSLSSDSKRLFSDLMRLPLFALRMGKTSTNGRTWKVKPSILKPANGNAITVNARDIQPNISQKGVDMKIGLDMATLALKKQVSALVLITGDSDFVPAIKLARTEGVQIYLANMGHSIKPEMYEHIDVLLDSIY